jgi:hypothetical protein
MKKALPFFFVLALLGIAVAEESLKSLNAPTSIPASTSSNYASTTAFDLSAAVPSDKMNVRIYGAFNGVGGTTNGSLVAYFSASYDGTSFDTASQSNIKLTIPCVSNQTVQASDWVNLVGVKAIRLGRLENGAPGAISNLVFKLNFMVP